MSNVSKISHNCSKDCVWCMKSFVIYDHPNHIGRIRNIEKQNSFLRSKNLNFIHVLFINYNLKKKLIKEFIEIIGSQLREKLE